MQSAPGAPRLQRRPQMIGQMIGWYALFGIAALLAVAWLGLRVQPLRGDHPAHRHCAFAHRAARSG